MSEPTVGHGGPNGSDEHGPVIRDKRRIDPLTGAVREPAAAASPPVPPPASPPASPSNAGFAGPAGAAAEAEAEAGAVDAALSALEAEASAYKADLQRVHAEYANYRKRVDRDRELVREAAVAATLAELLPVLDDIGRAREHGELEGGFRSVGEALEAAVVRVGLERYGEVGDPFDPTVHEALTHAHSDEVTETVCAQVFQPGYRYAGRVVRPARVGVAEPS